MVLRQNFSCDTEDCIHWDTANEECKKGCIKIQDGCCCDYEKKLIEETK